MILRSVFFIRQSAESPILRTHPKYSSDVRQPLEISRILDFENAKSDAFRNFKTTFCIMFLVSGETESRSLYTGVCSNETGNCC